MTEPTMRDHEMALEACRNWARDGAFIVGTVAMKLAEAREDGRREAAAWRPIETAPCNESVLIFIPNAEHYGPGIYRGMLVEMGTGRHWDANGLHMGRACGPDNQPTHWMPLPEPPQ